MSRLNSVSPEEIELIRKSFHYDPQTGAITRLGSTHYRVKPGPVTTMRVDYIVCFLGRKRYAAHRVAWLLHYGVWPDHEIDHINLVPTDNRACNLRAADRRQNTGNTSVRKDSASRLKGVGITKSGRFDARIKDHGKRTHIGTFDSAEEAHRAYCERAKIIFGEFASASDKVKP